MELIHSPNQDHSLQGSEGRIYFLAFCIFYSVFLGLWYTPHVTPISRFCYHIFYSDFNPPTSLF